MIIDLKFDDDLKKKIQKTIQIIKDISKILALLIFLVVVIS